jgi:hypothetical protein
MFKENTLKSTEGSLGGVGRDKKPSAAKNFSMKFSRRVKNATPAATSSPIAPVTYIFMYGDGLAHIPKI